MPLDQVDEASMRLPSFLSNGSCFPLLALGLGLVVRAYPEILAGPYPLGFDTVTGYLSRLMTTNMFALPISQLLRGDNLYYVVQQGVFDVTGDAFVTLKLLPVLLYGLFTLSIYFYSVRALKLGRRTALLASAFAALSWLALRVSWDLERNMLGLVLAVFALTLVASDKRKWRLLGLPLALLAVWAHQLVAVFLIGALGVEWVWEVSVRRKMEFEHLVYIVPCALLFLYESYSPTTLVAVPGWTSAQGFGLGETLGGLTYFLLLGWPLLLLSAGLLFKKAATVGRAILVWSVLPICFGLVFPLLSFNTVWPYRLWLMMAFPLPILAAMGAQGWPKLLKAAPSPAMTGVLLLLALAVPFLSLQPQLMPANVALGVQNYGPSSYQQNVVPVNSTPQLVEVLKEGGTANRSSVLLLPDQFMGLAEYEHIGGTVDLGLVGSWYNRPLGSTAVAEAQALAAPCVTVWWTGSIGWYGLPTPSHDLMIIGGNDMFALYKVMT